MQLAKYGGKCRVYMCHILLYIWKLNYFQFAVEFIKENINKVRYELSKHARYTFLSFSQGSQLSKVFHVLYISLKVIYEFDLLVRLSTLC